MTGLRVIFRADADATIGTGHVMRCLVLARSLRQEGWSVGFATQAATVKAVPDLAQMGIEILEVDGTAEDEAQDMAARWPDGAMLLIVDHYRRDAAFERGCRPWTTRILAIDDLADRPHDADFLLDQNLGRLATDYDGLVPDACKRMIGPRWALLRPEFARLRPAALARRKTGALDRVLIAFGGADVDNLSCAALDAVEASPHPLSADVAIGPAGKHLDALKARVARMGPRAVLHIGTLRMAELMAEADISLGAGGSTSWERCCLGLPSVVAIVAENQQAATMALASASAVLVADVEKEDATAAFGRGLETLIRDRLLYARMSARASDVTDGNGAQRMAEALRTWCEDTNAATG